MDEVSYKYWVTVDRCNLEIITKNIKDFVALLVDSQVKLESMISSQDPSQCI